MQSSVNNAIKSLEKLETTASVNQTKNKTAKKPSVITQLRENQALVDISKSNTPAQSRSAVKEAGI
jgi:hypothetical protein